MPVRGVDCSDLKEGSCIPWNPTLLCALGENKTVRGMLSYLVNFGPFFSLIVEDRMFRSYLVHFGPFLLLSSRRECLYIESTTCDSASHEHVSLQDPRQLSGNNVLR